MKQYWLLHAASMFDVRESNIDYFLVPRSKKGHLNLEVEVFVTELLVVLSSDCEDNLQYMPKCMAAQEKMATNVD